MNLILVVQLSTVHKLERWTLKNLKNSNKDISFDWLADQVFLLSAQGRLEKTAWEFHNGYPLC